MADEARPAGPFGLLLIGCGRMGSALLAGWGQKLKDELRVTVVDPVKPAQKQEGVFRWMESLAVLPQDYVPEVVLLAVKPQSMDAALKDIRQRKGWEDVLFLSIAAGKDTAYFRRHLGPQALVVRMMPNTPALIGKGATALYAVPSISEAGREWAGRLMETVGEIFWLDDEKQMDVFTALAGSGPAYFYYLIESMTEAGKLAGLPPLIAERAALLTAHGATTLAMQAKEAPAALRSQVTSPGGTTEAAMEVLSQKRGFPWLMQQAILAAVKRAREL